MDTRSNEDILVVVANQVLVGMSGECEDGGKVVVTVGGGEYASEEDSVADVTGVDDMDTTEIADDKNSVDTGDDVGVVNEQDAHVIQVPYKEEIMPEVAKEEAEVNWSALEVIDDTDVIGNGVLVLIVGVPA